MQRNSPYKAPSPPVPCFPPFPGFQFLLEKGLVLWSMPQGSSKTGKTELAITEGTLVA